MERPTTVEHRTKRQRELLQFLEALGAAIHLKGASDLTEQLVSGGILKGR
jgi:hypothetical protein